MKERVQIELLVNGTDNSTLVKNKLNTYLATLNRNDIYQIDESANTMLYLDKNYVLLEIRLQNVEAYIAVKDKVIEITSVEKDFRDLVLIKSKITHHVCPHDDNVGKCIVANEWTKTTSRGWAKTI